MRVSFDSQKVVQGARRRTAPHIHNVGRNGVRAESKKEVPESLLPGFKTLADVPGTSWYIRARLAESRREVSPNAGMVVRERG